MGRQGRPIGSKDRFRNNVSTLGAFRGLWVGILRDAVDKLFLNLD